MLNIDYIQELSTTAVLVMGTAFGFLIRLVIREILPRWIIGRIIRKLDSKIDTWADSNKPDVIAFNHGFNKHKGKFETCSIDQCGERHNLPVAAD